MAVLSRQKRLPPLQRLLGRVNRKPPTPEELERRRRDHEEIVASMKEALEARGVSIQVR